MKCYYCNSYNHKIKKCPYDNEIIKIMYSTEVPNFDKLTHKVIKKLAVLNNINIYQSRYKIINKLYQKYNHIITKQSLNNCLNNQCPICFESIDNYNSCTTSCNHTFHLSCLLQSKQNNCPICRKIIPHKQHSNNDCLYRHHRRATRDELFQEWFLLRFNQWL